MSRIARIGLGIAAVGWCAGMPSAAADNPICSENVCSFYSPTHTISCEIDYQRPGLPDSTYCQVSPPAPAPQSVHMDPVGTYSVCPGESCLGNPGLGQPTLEYDQSATLGPFSCRSDVDGMTCRVVSGCGFRISGSAVTKVRKQ
ncbi:hypothetical protein [Mycobacterium shigaense]|nr:hypothetical protein [Mycobacterium shigaense]